MFTSKQLSPLETKDRHRTSEKYRILVVDDELAILEYMKALLISKGHDVSAARCNSSEEAAKIISNASSSAFDFAIVDVMMPGMDGVRMIEQLCTQSPATMFILSDTGLCIDASEHLKKQRIQVRSLLKPFESGDLERLLNDMSSMYACEFRGFMRRGLKADAHRGLADGDRLAWFLQALLEQFIAAFDLNSAPPEIRPRLQSAAAQLTFYGLRMHCLLMDPGCRFQHDELIGLDELEGRWLPKSLAASQYMQAYGEPSRNLLKQVFNEEFDRQVEPLQKQLGLGWWRRLTNRNKFANLFYSGALLGFVYDLKANELSKAQS